MVLLQALAQGSVLAKLLEDAPHRKQDTRHRIDLTGSCNEILNKARVQDVYCAATCELFELNLVLTAKDIPILTIYPWLEINYN